MNLFETLKQFKSINPDPHYTEVSKRAALAMTPVEAKSSVRKAWRTMLAVIETGVAVALTGFFIFLMTGGLSGTKLSPAPFAAIDPNSLKAEAQAIDMQIQLAHLTYNESAQSTLPLSKTDHTSTVAAAALSTLSIAAPTTVASASTTVPVATTTATSSLTIEQALESLSQ